MFSEIDFHLKNNQNVAIYGYGSKLKLINYYVDFYLSDYPLIVFYGFYGEISFKQILNTIEKMIRKISEDNQDNTKIIKSLKVDDRIEAIKNNLEKIELKKIFIIIHNIDGKKLANEKCQENLSKIASLQKVKKYNYEELFLIHYFRFNC